MGRLRIRSAQAAHPRERSAVQDGGAHPRPRRDVGFLWRCHAMCAWAHDLSLRQLKKQMEIFRERTGLFHGDTRTAREKTTHDFLIQSFDLFFDSEHDFLPAIFLSRAQFRTGSSSSCFALVRERTNEILSLAGRL